MTVWRTDTVEMFQRTAARSTAAPVRENDRGGRFSLDDARPKPAATPRPDPRRTEADRTPTARDDAGRTIAKETNGAQEANKFDDRDRTDRTDTVEARRGGDRPGPMAQAVLGRDTPPRSRPVAEDGEPRSDQTQRNPAKSAVPPEHPPAAGAGSAQQATAEQAVAEEAGTVMAAETGDEAEGTDETASPQDAATADPAALLAPFPPPAPPVATATSPTPPAVPVADGTGEGNAIAGGVVTAVTGAGRGVPEAGTGLASDAAEARSEKLAAVMPDGSPAGPQTGQVPAQAISVQAISAQNVPAPAISSHAAGATAEASPAQQAQPAAPPIPLNAVAMTIGLRSLAGINRFEIRLDPVELGRIDVSLELDKQGGKARARLVVDRRETLALLQRDAGSLQQALSQAGFDLAAEAGGIDLSLRGESGSQGGRGGDGSPRGRSEGPQGGRAEAPSPLDLATLRPLRATGNLDIRI